MPKPLRRFITPDRVWGELWVFDQTFFEKACFAPVYHAVTLFSIKPFLKRFSLKPFLKRLVKRLVRRLAGLGGEISMIGYIAGTDNYSFAPELLRA